MDDADPIGMPLSSSWTLDMVQVNKPHPRQEVIITGSSRSLYAWRPRPSGGAGANNPCLSGACRQLCLSLRICSAVVIDEIVCSTSVPSDAHDVPAQGVTEGVAAAAARQTRRLRSSRQRLRRPGERRPGRSASMAPEASCSSTPTTRPQRRRRSGRPPQRMMPARARARARRNESWFSNVRCMHVCSTYDDIWQITAHDRVACMLYLGAVDSPQDRDSLCLTDERCHCCTWFLCGNCPQLESRQALNDVPGG